MNVVCQLIKWCCDPNAPAGVRGAAEQVLDAAFYSLLRPWWRLPAGGRGGDDGESDETAMVFDGSRCAESIQITSLGNVAHQVTDKVWGTVLASKGFAPQSGVHQWTVRMRKCTRGYVFLGVATREASTSNYIGGDNHGWGMIGTKALWHGHQKVRAGYGQDVNTGMLVLVSLDTNRGTLSFGNATTGRDWGVAFQNVQAREDLYPAVALYQKDDEAEIAAVRPHIDISSSDVLRGGDGERMATEAIAWEASRAQVPVLTVGATCACMSAVAGALGGVAPSDIAACSQLMQSHCVRVTLAMSIGNLLSWSDSHFGASVSIDLLDAATSLARTCTSASAWLGNGEVCKIPHVADVSGLWVFKSGEMKGMPAQTYYVMMRMGMDGSVHGFGGLSIETTAQGKTQEADTPQWRQALRLGSALDGRDREGVWYQGVIERVTDEGAFVVRFDGWAPEFNEQFPRGSEKLAPCGSKSVKPPLRVTGRCCGFQLELVEHWCGYGDSAFQLSVVLSADCSSFGGTVVHVKSGTLGKSEGSMQRVSYDSGQEATTCRIAVNRLHLLCSALSAKVCVGVLGGRIDDGVDAAVDFVTSGIAERDARPGDPSANEPAYATVFDQYGKELAESDPPADRSIELLRQGWSSELAECFDAADDAADESKLFMSSVVPEVFGAAGEDESAPALPDATERSHAVLASAELWAASPLFIGGIRGCVLEPCVIAVLSHLLVGRAVSVDEVVAPELGTDDGCPDKLFVSDFLGSPGSNAGKLDELAALVVERSLVVRRGAPILQVSQRAQRCGGASLMSFWQKARRLVVLTIAHHCGVAKELVALAAHLDPVSALRESEV